MNDCADVIRKLRDLGYEHMATRVEQLRDERNKLRQTHWDMRAKAGFDNDGDPTPIAVVSDFSKLMEDDWNHMIQDQQDAHDEWDNLQRDFEALQAQFKKPQPVYCCAKCGLPDMKTGIGE